MSNLKAIHQAMRLQPIDKLMVVGHPLSGYTSVEQVLHSCGLKPAATSKTQGLSPMQVSDMLLRAYRVQPLTELQALDNFKPIIPSPVWQSLALDLLLGNLDQELWGWADPQAIYLLDYWKNLDHQLAFVLVYDSPQASMAGLFDKPDVDCTEEVVQAASANWLAYNEALLNFYLGNTERCLLVHGQQVRDKTADYLRQVQHQMGVELQMPWGGVGGEVKHTSWNDLQTELCARVLSANPKMAQMYADLQSVASLPQGDVKAKPSFIADMAVLSKVVALNRSNLKIQQYVEELKAAKEAQEQALNQQLATLVQSFEKAHAYGHAMAQEKQQLVALAEDRLRNIEELRQKEAELLRRMNDLAEQLQMANQLAVNNKQMNDSDTELEKKILQEENKLLMEQLFQVQEDLERINEQSEKLETDLEINQVNQNPRILGAADRLKNESTYQLGAALVESKSSIILAVTLPYRLLKIYKRNINESKENLPNIESYEDSHEASKVKKHLSYKLGEVLQSGGKNPIKWLLIPIKIISIASRWRNENKRNKHE